MLGRFALSDPHVHWEGTQSIPSIWKMINYYEPHDQTFRKGRTKRTVNFSMYLESPQESIVHDWFDPIAFCFSGEVIGKRSWSCC